MSYNIEEELLREALLLQIDEQVTAYPPRYYEPHTFSRRFERKMRALIRQSKRPRASEPIRFSGRRMSAALLAAVLILLATIMGVGAFREKLFDFIEERFATYSRATFEPVVDAAVVTDSNIFITYAPTYIPEGLELYEEYQDEVQYRLYYMNDEGQDLLYVQMCTEDFEYYFNWEGKNIIPIELDGYPALYYENKGTYGMILYDDHYCYYIATRTTNETLYRVAKSLKLKK